jgi:enamine deaminase RidA (YjgF/YER057c/UK114 family)
MQHKPGPVAKRLEELGIVLPATPKPAASYVPATRVDNLVYTSGVGPTVDGKARYTGLVGRDVTLEQAQDAARLCAMNVLAIARDQVGLERIVRVLKVTGFVASAPGFTDQHKVMNGASDFLVQVLGDRGKHARSAVGVSGLPLDFAVEVEAVFQTDLGPYGIH